jgi:hypothetical protein
MAPNFASLLNKPADDVKRPVTLPDGTYFGTIKSHELAESSQKKTPYVRYNVELTHAHDDTDTEGEDPAGKKVRVDFYITDESTYRLIDFCGSCGITTEGRSLGEIIPQPIGQTVMVDIVKKPSQNDPEQYFNEVRKCVGMAAEDAPQDDTAEIAEAQGRRRRS